VFYPVAMSKLDDEAGGRASFVLTWALASQSVGLASMHAVLGRLSDAFGLGKALWIGPICLAFVCIMLMRRRSSPR
jgi:MFS family permease